MKLLIKNVIVVITLLLLIQICQAECLNSTLITESAGKWLAQVNLQIANNCNSAVEMNKTFISFQSNGLSMQWFRLPPYDRPSVDSGQVNADSNQSMYFVLPLSALQPHHTVNVRMIISTRAEIFDNTRANNTLLVLPNYSI